MRYSALLSLHEQLLSVHPDAIKRIQTPFPPKSLFAGKSVQELRREQLNRYIAAVAGDAELGGSVLFRTRMGATDGLVLYKTFSTCPICTVLDRAGIVWLPAVVEELQTKVYLSPNCPKHGISRTLRCSNAEFFRRMVQRNLRGGAAALDPAAPGWLGAVAAAGLEAAKRTHVPSIKTRCAVVDLPLFEGGEFITDARIVAACANAEAARAILRVQGKLASDVQQLNAKVLTAAAVSKTIVIAEMSHDRLIQLAALPDSCVLSRRVLPAVRYFLQRGEEKKCHQDLVATIAELSSFSEVQLYVTLCVERPFPDLTWTLRMLRRHCEMVRFISVSLSRPREQVQNSAKHHRGLLQQATAAVAAAVGGAASASAKSSSYSGGGGGGGRTKPGGVGIAWPSSPAATVATPEPSIDIFELVTALCTATDGELAPADFVSPWVRCSV
jgi:hypothetical protein